MTQQLVKFEELKNGGLKIKLTPEGKVELKEMIADGKSYNELWDAIMEYDHCNGGYRLVEPELVGALTSSPIIVNPDGVDFDDDGIKVNSSAKVWWFPDYQIVNEIHELLKNRSIIFEQ